MLAWLESTFLGEMMRNVQWAFPISEAFHFLGLCVLMGSIAIIDLRLLGFARGVSVKVIHQLLPWAWVGFTVNLVTGILFFFSNPLFYYENTAFRIKLVLMLLAGANALWFHLKVNRELDSWPDSADAPGQVKVMAGGSLALWVAVICFGRFIMYWPPF